MKIDQCACDDYGERMKAGEKFPAVDVFFDGENHWLADGFHRLRAYVMAVPGEPIECNVYQGSLEDAQWHSYSVNKTHGIRRSNEDKQRAVTMALGHPNAAGKSNVQIAEHCGVSEFMVRKHRTPSTSIKSKSNSSATELLPSTDQPTSSEIPKSRPRKGRDGRTINTAKIGKTRGGRSPQPRSAAEYADARRAGLKVRRPDSLIKLELPNNNVTNCAYDLLQYFTFKYLQKVFVEIVRLNQERQETEHD